MKMSEQQRVAYNFKRLREEGGWTQEELAALRHVSQNYIAQIEGNHCDFGVRARKKWADIFGVDISEFFKIPEGSRRENTSDLQKKKIG
jgi:transcriptional regulator with XRE-family HTH domain